MSNPIQWLKDLSTGSIPTLDGSLVPVQEYPKAGRPSEVVSIMEKAEYYKATAVFFEAERDGKPPVAQAFIYVSDGPKEDPEFARRHQQLWSWGGVPLVYRVTPGLVQLFRCAHKADFELRGTIVFRPFKEGEILNLASKIADNPWWDADRLRNGTIWDDPKVCKDLLSAKQAAHKTLIEEVKILHKELNAKGILPKALRRKLLILSVLIKYLEERRVFEDNYFTLFRTGATQFFEILGDGRALVSLLDKLEERFNGHVFALEEADRKLLYKSQQLARFARFVEGKQEPHGQLTLWERYSFADLPVELISHIYQLFVTDSATAVYTPPFLVRLILGEVLTWERLDRLTQNKEIILDPACGSGIFLVEAYKRLVLYWRSQNNWNPPSQTVLKNLLMSVHGVDLEGGAVELAAFSLCLALCDALKPEEIRASVKLFPELKENTVRTGCFFEYGRSGMAEERIGVIVGNPPFTSTLGTDGAKQAYKRYKNEQGVLPDKQLAYLFLHESMQMLVPGGVLSMLQQYNFLYNQQSKDFRRKFFERWDVREILDFISIRGLFQKGGADTKVVVVVAEANQPKQDKQILHATFRRSGRADAEQGFDIDYYDLHWLPRELALANDGVWRSDLLGGGRVLGLVDRLKRFPTLEKYAEKQKWDYGEGFIAGTSGKLTPGPHITGKALIEPRHLNDQVSLTSLKKVQNRNFRSPYTPKRYQSPMVLVHEHEDLTSRYFPTGYYTYTNKIVGFCAGDGVSSSTSSLAKWLKTNRRTLSALVCAGGTTMFTQRASSVGLQNILSLPSPECELDIAPHEQILVDDIVDYYRDLIRLGDDSAAMMEGGVTAIHRFNYIYTQQINAIYKKKTLNAVDAYKWPGVICQPFIFGKGEVDWTGADQLRDKLDKLLRKQRGSTFTITRIARIYDGPCIYLLKPDRLRYWLRSIALRDADETLADLWQQGF